MGGELFVPVDISLEDAGRETGRENLVGGRLLKLAVCVTRFIESRTRGATPREDTHTKCCAIRFIINGIADIRRVKTCTYNHTRSRNNKTTSITISIIIIKVIRNTVITRTS